MSIRIKILKSLIYLFICIVIFIYLFPLFYVLNTSLKSEQEFLNNPLSIAGTFHFGNYFSAWIKGSFSNYIFNSILYTGLCTSVSMLLAVFAAFPVSRRYLKRTDIIYILFLSVLFLPNGLIPLFQLILKMHLYNTRLGYMLTMISGGGVPFFFFTSYIKSIPKDFDEAVTIDGCGYFKFIFRIIIPLMKPAIASMSILYAINIWNEIIGATVFLSSTELYPITRGIFVFSGQYQNQWNELTAAMIIVALPLILVYACGQKYIIDGALAGAIKG